MLSAHPQIPWYSFYPEGMYRNGDNYRFMETSALAPFKMKASFGSMRGGESALKMPEFGILPDFKALSDYIMIGGLKCSDSSIGLPHLSNAVDMKSICAITEARILSQRKDKIDCYFWKAGDCPEGDQCPFKHDQAVQEAERIRRAHAAEKDAAKTLSRTFMKSTRVIFGAGASVIRIITAFEPCTVLVKGLPLGATGMNTGDKTHQEARVVFDDTLDAANAAAGLSDIEFREQTLQLELVSLKGGRGQMTEYSKDRDTLTVSWSAPSIRVLVMYESIAKAEAMAKALDRKIYAGRRVRVSLNVQPFGQTSRYFIPSAIVIRNLPPSVMADEIRAFSGSSSIKFLKQRTYDLSNVHGRFRADMEGQLCSETVKEYQILDNDSVLDGFVTVRIQFEKWEDAKKVHDFLKDGQLDYIPGLKLHPWLPDPIIFARTIPAQQYEAQKDVLTDIEKNCKDERSARIMVRLSDARASGVVQVLVLGDDQKAVGALRVRAERVLAGEKLDIWDGSFATAEGAGFLSSLLGATGALVVSDARQKELKAFGTPGAIEAARARVKEEVDRLALLALLDYTVDLNFASSKFFIREIATLREAIGRTTSCWMLPPPPPVSRSKVERMHGKF
ncbi:hypothetical protein A0H81_08176 [Grifola frondosa]|uniref:C3H1-type domain-containing protein n=1 Tax=Grifola frondosa TaxID=5627 RepID=A0A1C7M499_GRIFR|nr:hypothetical protein A0H81_08176 [Grifola frondosa]